MVIVSKLPGQLCNNLWLLAALIANAIEYDYHLLFDFRRYARHFTATRHNDFGGFRIGAKFSEFHVASRLAGVALRALVRGPSPMGCAWETLRIQRGMEALDLNDEGFLNTVRNRSLLLEVDLFHQVRDDRNLLKHADRIRSFFRPVRTCEDRIRRRMQGLRGAGQLVVGVHMRRGDYKLWRGGAYFFSVEAYADKMTQLQQLFRHSGLRVAFLVCSDEEVDAARFAGLTAFVGSGEPVEDLYSLAGCDLIVGPPSTYSMWASFAGAVPLSVLTHQDMLLNKDDFTVVTDVGRMMSLLGS